MAATGERPEGDFDPLLSVVLAINESGAPSDTRAAAFWPVVEELLDLLLRECRANRKRVVTDFALEPELLDPHTDFEVIAAARRGHQERINVFAFGDTPEGEIAGRLQNYRGHIRSIREAGSKGWRTQRRRLLRHQADRLVEALWMYGIRKVDPAMRARPRYGYYSQPEASA